MMLSLDEFKELILFAKAHKIKSVEIGNLKFEVSDYAFIEQAVETVAKEELNSQKTLVDTNLKEQDLEDEELLYYSSNP